MSIPQLVSPYLALLFDSLCHSLLKTASYPLLSYKQAVLKSSPESDQPITHDKDSPLFVTWNIQINNESHLRGCIGTFSDMQVEEGIRDYALISLFEDTRFNAINERELSFLECSVTLLKNFETCSDPLDWELGKHGIKINFVYKSRRYAGTFLPEVAVEQGWSKVDTLQNLIKKLGVYKSISYEDVEMQVIRYQGEKSRITYNQYLQLRKDIE